MQFPMQGIILSQSKQKAAQNHRHERKETHMTEKIYTKDAPAAIGPYSQAIVCGNTVYASGQIPIIPATGKIAEGDITVQSEQVMKNIGNILKAAGTDFTKAVKTTCFLADMGDFAAFNEVYGKYFTGKPARSCVAVKSLPKNVLVEVEVIAAK
jgi:2-iminobutanoate/2-iminopropanoate deaminase